MTPCALPRCTTASALKTGRASTGPTRSFAGWGQHYLLVTLLSITIGLVLTRLIAPPLVAAAAALEEVAQKNLAVSVEARGSDEVGRLSHALNKTVGAMREILRAVGRTADSLSGAAEELSVQSMQTSGNTELQTSQTQQIAAAAEEMSATIAEISRNAEAASVASRKAAETAAEGGESCRRPHPQWIRLPRLRVRLRTDGLPGPALDGDW